MLTRSGRLRRIAVKIIDRRRAPADFVLKFLPRELEIYRQLAHPNIVRVYEFVEIHARIYVLMELAEGGDLLELIKVIP